jgi:transposase
MEGERSHKRRRYSAEVKAQILAECAVPGASVAKVALSHGINANIVHGWRKQVREGEPASAMVRQEFVPVTVTPPVQAHSDGRGIEVELRRGAMTIKLMWPMSAAADLAAWMRELLR